MKGKLLFILAACLSLTACSKVIEKKVPELKKDTINIEFGDPLKLKNEDLLDTEDASIYDTIKVDTSTVAMQEGESYPAVGEYEVPLSFEVNGETQNKTLMINVQDTTPPTFTITTDVVELGLKGGSHNFYADFEAQDLSNLKLRFKTNDVRFDKTGEYKAQAVATDIYDNESVYDFTVRVGTTVDSGANSQSSGSTTTTNNSTTTNNNTYYYDWSQDYSAYDTPATDTEGNEIYSAPVMGDQSYTDPSLYYTDPYQ